MGTIFLGVRIVPPHVLVFEPHLNTIKPLRLFINTIPVHQPCVAPLHRAIKRQRTRSAAVCPVSNAHERDLVTNQNVWFRPFLGQKYLLERLFFRSSSRAAGNFSQRRWELDRKKDFPKGTFDLKRA